MKTSLFYELTLKRWWEQIYSCENDQGKENKVVKIDARVRRLTTSVYGMEAEKEGRYDADGFLYFRARDIYGMRIASIGLSAAIYEKLKQLQGDRGWFDNAAERDVRVSGENSIRSSKYVWRKFAYYVLVESFILRRMDGSVVLNF